jgi:hypothetical protein
MKAILATVLLAACSSSTTIQPDAPLPTVHDQLLDEECDLAWGDTASHCEHACLQKPQDLPCKAGDAPCLDMAGCTAANGRMRIDCPTTFLAEDYQGKHVGCCAIRTGGTISPPLQIPTFYECVK